jgi:hypothetical protein
MAIASLYICQELTNRLQSVFGIRTDDVQESYLLICPQCIQIAFVKLEEVIIAPRKAYLALG